MQFKVAWTNRVRSTQEADHKKVLEVLRISEEQYYDLMIDNGTYYLTEIIGVGIWREEFLQSKLYWKWWLNHWRKWDAEFLAQLAHTPNYEMHQLYDDTHNVLQVEFRPHAVILEDVFHKEVAMKLAGGAI